MNIKNKKIFLTGITGTLGESVAVRFLKEGAEIRALIRDKKNNDYYESIGVIPITGDLNDMHPLKEALGMSDIVIHCAAYLGDDEGKAIRSNVDGVENLAKLSLMAGIKKFIHVSTLSVYGEPNEGAIDEFFPIQPNHEETYIRTKSISEVILNEYKKKGLDVIILRPGAICAEVNSYWGDRQINRMIQTDIVDWVHSDDLIAWIHVDNLVEMMYLTLSKGISNEVFNAIDGNFPEKEFRVKMITALKKDFVIPSRDAECPIYSNSKIVSLGYSPVKTFEQTVLNLLDSV